MKATMKATMKAATKVVIAAAYASVRAGLAALLGDFPEIAVVAEVSGAGELETALLRGRPAVVLAEDVPESRGRLLDLLAGDIGLVLLGDARDGWGPLASAPLRGWGYLLRDAEGAEIAGAIAAAGAGLVALDRSLLPAPNSSALSFSAAEDADCPDEALTAREREVLELLARGLPNKQVAARLGISPHTVKFHVASLLAKLGASSRTEAVTLGARRGWVSF